MDLKEIKILEHLPISTQKIKLIQQHTMEDEALQKVVEYINKGSWLTHLKDCNALARPFFHIRDEMAFHSNVLFKGERVVIPQKLRKSILE